MGTEENDIRLIVMGIVDGYMPTNVAKNPDLLNLIFNFIKQMPIEVNNMVLENIKNGDLSPEECSNHIEKININLETDLALLEIMARKSKTLEGLLEISRVFFHHRKNDKEYSKKIISEYSKPENEIEGDVWFLYLTHKDPYYLRLSIDLEKFVFSMIFKTASKEKVDETIDFSFKKSCSSFKTMTYALFDLDLPIERWMIIRNKAITREEFKEILEIAEEKIKTHQT